MILDIPSTHNITTNFSMTSIFVTSFLIFYIRRIIRYAITRQKPDNNNSLGHVINMTKFSTAIISSIISNILITFIKSSFLLNTAHLVRIIGLDFIGNKNIRILFNRWNPLAPLKLLLLASFLWLLLSFFNFNLNFLIFRNTDFRNVTQINAQFLGISFKFFKFFLLSF